MQKFVIKWLLDIPPRLNHVATLFCDMGYICKIRQYLV